MDGELIVANSSDDTRERTDIIRSTEHGAKVTFFNDFARGGEADIVPFFALLIADGRYGSATMPMTLPEMNTAIMIMRDFARCVLFCGSIFTANDTT